MSLNSSKRVATLIDFSSPNNNGTNGTLPKGVGTTGLFVFLRFLGRVAASVENSATWGLNIKQA